jgi:hypothetical protein
LCAAHYIAVQSFVEQSLPPQTHSLGYLTMSKWAQQIREAKGPALNLSYKGITATECVEIARALEVIPNVPSLCLAHTNDGVGCVSGQACFSLSRWLAKSVSFPIFAYFSLCFGLLSVECPFSVITPITPSIFAFLATRSTRLSQS